MNDYMMPPLEYTDIIFNSKPDAVPYNCRISYKVSQLCLLMERCGRAGVCSLVKIHMISYSLISKDNWAKMVDGFSNLEHLPVIRFDPSVNKAILFAIAYGYIEQRNDAKYRLTEKGRQFANKIISDGNLMVNEINVLNTISKQLTEKKVSEIVDAWRKKNAED